MNRGLAEPRREQQENLSLKVPVKMNKGLSISA